MRQGVIAAGFLAVLSLGTDAQSPPDAPRFEVASVKQSVFENDAYFQGFLSGGGLCALPFTQIAGQRVALQKTTLCGLIRFAFDVKDYEVVGQPVWMLRREPASFYDIDTRTERDVSGTTNQEQLRQMVLSLLTERFQLRTHWDSREMPVYALVVAKDGPKLGAKSAETPCPNAPEAAFVAGPGMFASCKPETTMARLANTLSRQVDRAVIDDTGLTGGFAFRLTWSPDPTSPSPNGAPGIFTAIQEQLGLKLEPRRAKSRVLVIDAAEKPSPN